MYTERTSSPLSARVWGYMCATQYIVEDCPDKLLYTEEEVYDLLSTLDVSKSNGHLRSDAQGNSFEHDVNSDWAIQHFDQTWI